MNKGTGLRVYAIAYLIFLYAPIALLPIFAFNDSKVIAFPLQGFSTVWFQAMWSDDQLFKSLKNSMMASHSVQMR